MNTPADVASLPANCRQRLMHEGKAYPRSGCAACGKWMPRAKECEAALAKPASGDGGKLVEWLRRVHDAGTRLGKHLGEGQPHMDMVAAITGASALALEHLATPEQPGSSVQGEACSPGEAAPPPNTPAQHYLAEHNGCASQDWQDGFNACARTTPPPAPAAEQGEIVADVAKEAGVKVGDVLKFLHRALAMNATANQRINHDITGCVVEYFRAQPEARGVEGLEEEVRQMQPSPDVVGGAEEYGFSRARDMAVMKIRKFAAAPAAPGVRVDEAMVGDVRADIMRSAANDGCPIVIKDAWVREALTAALAPDGGERKDG